MKIAACNLSIVPLRAEPSHRSEMVSQILFGEFFEIIEESIDFVKVRLLSVDYEGWVQRNQYTLLSRSDSNDSLIVDFNGAVAISDKHKVKLYHGTSIHAKDLLIGEESFRIEGTLRQVQLDDFETEFVKIIAYYSNTPYLWGGRSIAGIDCSGFSQVVYKHFGVLLLRDAWQQAEMGDVVDFLTEIKAGDLAFFDNEAGRITHVGIMIDSETIIHASGRVRIDKMDSEGIFNVELNKYTHKLRIVKRYF